MKDEKIMQIISRPLPFAVPGNIIKYEFNRKNQTFKLKFNAENSTRQKVEIYSPKPPVEISSNGKSSYKHIDDSEAVMIYIGVCKGENTIEIKI